MPVTNAEASGAQEHRTPWFTVNALVLSHRRIVLNEFEIVLRAPEIARHARPGQFVMLLLGEGYSTEARRPFSLFRVDPDSGTISIFYLARGSFTSELAQKLAGDVVVLAGPLGRPFEWFQVPHTRHVMVAGGIGAPPIYFLSREIACWRDTNSDPTVSTVVINAAKSAELLVGTAEFKSLNIDVRVVTGDGSSGEPGMATDVLQRVLEVCSETTGKTRVYACGPMAMLRNVGALSTGAAVSCQLSIETAMPCGVGDCDGCSVRVFDEHSETGYSEKRACCEGPVFEAGLLAWPIT